MNIPVESCDLALSIPGAFFDGKVFPMKDGAMRAVKCFAFFLAVLYIAGCDRREVVAKDPEGGDIFVIEERFGISHPEQLLHFEVRGTPDPANSVLLDETGTSVPFQITSNGRLVLKTGLESRQRRSWTLARKKGGQKHEPEVTLVETVDYYEISNGLTGIRIPKGGNVLPKTPAPIQGIQFRDGSWTAEGPNWMDSPALSMGVIFEEKGPLLVRAKVVYRYHRRKVHGKKMPEAIPEGEGVYSQTIEVQAGQPSIFFEEDSEVEASYRINITKGLFAEQARYNGHHANSVEAGRMPDGRVYGIALNKNERLDALVDLSPDVRNRWSDAAYPFLSFWDPWSVDTGFYWQLYNTKGKSANLLGIFSGRASRILSPALSGVAVDVWRVPPGKGDQPGEAATPGSDFEVGLKLKLSRLAPTQIHSARVRFQWGLFVGRIDKDLFPEKQVQAIGRQMNLRGGVNLDFVKEINTEYPDMPNGYGNLFVKSGAVPHELTEETAKKAYTEIVDFAQYYLDVLVNGMGIYNAKTVYFMGCMRIFSQMQQMDQLLDSTFLTEEERRNLKAIAALYASLLWHEDVVPMLDGTGMNMGPYNMVSMWLSTRYAYTIFVASNPQFGERVKTAKAKTHELMYKFINEDGAGSASPWYIHTANTPLLALIQQLKMLGEGELFLKDPRLRRHAEFLMQLNTPADPRFGGLRKLVALGHGSVAGSWLLGQLGTLYAENDPELSSRLMGAWKQSGNPHAKFFGDSRFRIDEGLPTGPLKLKTDDFLGYLSVMRFNCDEPTETALWFVNGSGYFDHRQADQGDVMIHALGAPLAENWGSYSVPITSGARLQNVVTLEAALEKPWNTDEVPFSETGDMGMAPWGRETTLFPMVAFSASAKDHAQFPGNKDYEWGRTVTTVNADPARPIFIVDDKITAKDHGASNVIITWNMAAQGEVQTPDGSITPAQRTYHEAVKLKERPSSADVRDLKSGLNRFQFTGQYGIDWDLYSIAPAASQFALGNWGYMAGAAPLMTEFRKAQGRPFEWRQHILWFKGGPEHRTVILPRLKSDLAAAAEVSQAGGLLRIKAGEKITVIGKKHYSYESGQKMMLTTYDGQSAEGVGIRIERGPAEVILTGNKAVVTVAGEKGARRIILPKGKWTTEDTEWKQQQGGGWARDFPGNAAETAEFINE